MDVRIHVRENLLYTMYVCIIMNDGDDDDGTNFI